MAARPPCPTTAPVALPAGSLTSINIETGQGIFTVKVGTADPLAAASFVALAACGYYEGTVFHRIIPAFEIVGGDGQFGRVGFLDPTKVGTGGPGYSVPDEKAAPAYPRGTLVLDRTETANSGGSRFFVVLDSRAGDALVASKLPFAIIGTVTSGLDVLDAIAETANTGSPNYQPVDPVSITHTTIVASP